MIESTRFGRVPFDIVQSGAIKHLDAGELRVYIAIVAHVWNDKNTAWPGIDTIAQCAGCTDRTVRRNLSKLQDKGLIRISQGGGRHRSNVYTIEQNPDALGVTLSPPETMTPSVSGFRNPDTEKPGHLRPETRTSDGQNPDTLGVRRRDEENAAAAADVFSFLQKVGLTGKLLASCSALGDLTIDQAEAVWTAARTKAKNNPAGLFGRMLLDGDRGRSAVGSYTPSKRPGRVRRDDA